MPTTPIRGLGEVGIITDVPAQDLPLKAWTSGRNVRFSDGVISRYSVFKKLSSVYSFTKTPVGVIEGGGNQGDGYIVTAFSDGSLEQYFDGVITSVTPAGILGISTAQITTTFLGGVTYLNRETDAPAYRFKPSNGAFAPIPAWTSGNTCKSLRSYKDFLIAINCSLSGVDYPGMFKWSDTTQAGAPPASWDPAAIGTNAGENVINDLRGQLIDGRSLGNSFILYGEEQTYRVDYIGSPLIFNFDTIFEDQGAIAVNCIQEWEGKHFVFGFSDIYLHDGMVKVSIVDGFVKDAIFSELDYNLRSRCFTYHDKSNSEIAFCYPSIANDAPWLIGSVGGCNRAAVHNYKSKTWTFVDLPSVVGSCVTSSTKSITWEDLNGWDVEQAAWSAFDNTQRPSILFTSTGNTALAVSAQNYFLDALASGSLTNPLATDVLWDGYVIGLYKDLDEMGAELKGRKLLRELVPQINTESSEDIIKITVGQATTLTADVTWGSTMSFNPYTDYKYDLRSNSRYLGLKFEWPGTTAATLSGYDADIMIISGR